VATITCISHIHLYVRDPDRSLAFYRAVLGFEEKFRVRDQLFASTPDEGAWLTLHQSDADTVGTMGGVAHFGFALAEGQSLDDAVREAEQAGSRLIERGEHMPGLSYALLTDLDGYVFEI